MPRIVDLSDPIKPHFRWPMERSLKQDVDDCLMRRWADAREIALLILWRASDEASYVTAANFMVDGGRPVR